MSPSTFNHVNRFSLGTVNTTFKSGLVEIMSILEFSALLVFPPERNFQFPVFT